MSHHHNHSSDYLINIKHNAGLQTSSKYHSVYFYWFKLSLEGGVIFLPSYWLQPSWQCSDWPLECAAVQPELLNSVTAPPPGWSKSSRESRPPPPPLGAPREPPRPAGDTGQFNTEGEGGGGGRAGRRQEERGRGGRKREKKERKQEEVAAPPPGRSWKNNTREAELVSGPSANRVREEQQPCVNTKVRKGGDVRRSSSRQVGGGGGVS